MERWYEDYFAQSWYRNTYLVRRPSQIARQINEDRDWNNVYDSGCNFTCIAMLLGIDPARLASELAARRFFEADRSSLGRNVAGRIAALVWDQNEPLERHRTLKLKSLWHLRLERRVTLTVRFVGEEVTFDHREGRQIVERARARSEHVIAGAREHSHLVAGRIGGDFYLWDPDDTSVAVEDSLAGRLRLKDLFRFYAGCEPIEFWRYAVTRRIEPKRRRPRQWHYSR